MALAMASRVPAVVPVGWVNVGAVGAGVLTGIGLLYGANISPGALGGW
jgi:hypothetical protein